ncbi:hypothetical protein EDD17DRAFT_1514512 [Pisolithus thermaeus]|nr:hypothetical protein EDD17DRAFT_1514512 [Pisolithus thermaeus]
MPDTFVSHTTGHGRHCAEMEGSRVRVQNLTCHWVVHLSPRDISDPMIEPTHPVIFRVFSPPPRGLELERDPTAAECPNALLEMLKKGMPLTDASKMHTSNTVIRTLPAEAMPRSKICQTWIWGESGWMPVQEAGSGEPSWVTGKTMAMYRVKNRKCHP